MRRILSALCFNVIVSAYIVVALSTSEPTLLWGPYKPNLYFGLRTRVPKSLSLGLMWASDTEGFVDEKNLRHTFEQNDDVANYGWSTYDVRAGGIQTISDPRNKVDLRIEYLKPSKEGYDGSWGFRVQGNPRLNISTVLYLALENEGSHGDSHISCEPKAEFESKIDISCKGVTPSLKSFSIHIPAPDSVEGYTTRLSRSNIPDDELWKVKGRRYLSLHYCPSLDLI
jgi:mannosyl-oligosaccharide glucosidase